MQDSDPLDRGIFLHASPCAYIEACDDSQEPAEYSHLQSKTSNQYICPNFGLIALPLASRRNSRSGHLNKEEENVEPDKDFGNKACRYEENTMMGRWKHSADQSSN